MGGPESKASVTFDKVADAIDMPRSEFLELLFGKGIKVARHGKVGTSTVAKWEHLEPALGELVLCAPMIKEINHIAVLHTDLYEWSTEGLVVKIFQGTVRRFKVATILEAVTKLDSILPGLLHFQRSGRISKSAFMSMRSKLTEYLPEATAYSIKGQVRILETLHHLLSVDDQLTCVGYEDKAGTDVPADIILTGHTEGPEDRLIIEVEQIPDGRRKNGTAYEYLCERYAHKMSTIGEKLSQLSARYTLVLMAPSATELLAADIDRIEKDDRFL